MASHPKHHSPYRDVVFKPNHFVPINNTGGSPNSFSSRSWRVLTSPRKSPSNLSSLETSGTKAGRILSLISWIIGFLAYQYLNSPFAAMDLSIPPSCHRVWMKGQKDVNYHAIEKWTGHCQSHVIHPWALSLNWNNFLRVQEQSSGICIDRKLWCVITQVWIHLTHVMSAFLCTAQRCLTMPPFSIIWRPWKPDHHLFWKHRLKPIWF